MSPTKLIAGLGVATTLTVACAAATAPAALASARHHTAAPHHSANAKAAPHGASGLGGFSARPAEFSNADPITRAYFKLTIRPGRTETRSVIIANSKSVPMRLRIYAVEGVTAVTSGAVYSNRGQRPNQAGTWLTPSQTMITIAPRSVRRVSFTVRVPQGTTAGDHLGGIAVEQVNPAHAGTQFAITEYFRIVVGVEIRVPGKASRALALTNLTLRALPGTHFGSVVVSLVNRGGLLCKPRLRVSLQGAGPALVVTRRLDTFLPGDAIKYPVAWPASLLPGSYAAVVHATGCGAAASIARTVQAGNQLKGLTPSARAQSPQGGNSTPVWILALVGAGGLGLGLIPGLAIYGRRRNARHRREASDAEDRELVHVG